MRFEPGQLIVFALHALEEAAADARYGAVPRSWALRLALSIIVNRPPQRWVGIGVFRDFWRALRHAPSGERQAAIETALDGIYGWSGEYRSPERKRFFRERAEDLRDEQRTGRAVIDATMCNLYTTKKSVDEVAAWFRHLQMPLRFPEGIPNLAPKDIAITDPGPVIRAGEDGFDLIVRRWSWPGPTGKPVYNFRSDGREFTSGRCLIVADGFYEFTSAPDPRQKRKDRWLFTDPEGGLLGIAGLIREAPDIGEAFTMLTTEPGPDVAPYHSRQVAVLPSIHWKSWLDHSVSASDLIGPAPVGTLSVQPAPR